MKIWEGLGGFGIGCSNMTPRLGEGPKSSNISKDNPKDVFKEEKIHIMSIIELIKVPIKFYQKYSTFKIWPFGPRARSWVVS